MCTVKEIQEAIREDCKSQHDMDSTDIDRVMQTLPFAQEEPFTEARPRKPLFWFYARKFEKDFMPEDTEAGQIQGFLEHYTGSMVCSKQLFKEALGHTYDEPKRWQLHNINEIMNTVVTGWKPFSNPRMFTGYGRQRGWERDVSGNELPGNEDGFVELTEEECCQLELPKEWIA